MKPFTPVAHEGYKYVSTISDQFSRMALVYLRLRRDQALAPLQASAILMLIPLSSRIVWFHADKGGEYAGKCFHAYCLETYIKRLFSAKLNYTAADRHVRTSGMDSLCDGSMFTCR